ncbi:hypothetical protein TNCV_4138761 [Trichonephila clavipes]|nr:hypothetical protein TNCV_4138761 [Trichonephila clavipes]
MKNSGLCIRKKRLLLNGRFRDRNQGVTVPMRYCDILIGIERGDLEQVAWDLAFCCWMNMRDYTRRQQCKTILQFMVGSAYTSVS